MTESEGGQTASQFAADEVQDRCAVCGFGGVFKRTRPSVRETYECPSCGSSLRYRAQAAAIVDAYAGPGVATLKELIDTPGWQGLDILEPGIVGPFRKYLKSNPRYVQSFYWADVPLGQRRNGILCEDLTRTTFGDATFDLIVTSDILEHIRKPEEAFRELRRILRPGGRHIFSVPAEEPLQQETISRVDTSTAEDIFILPPKYHGSGDGGRSLVYTKFGEDLLETLGGLGLPTSMHTYRTPNHPVPDVYTFISTRGRAQD